MHFFYHGDYLPDNYGADQARFDGDFGFHAAVRDLAGEYGVEELRALAGVLLERAMCSGGGGAERGGGGGAGGVRLV